MQKIDAITYLAGIKKEEIPQADAPTNIHIITGEVSEDSEDGVARIEIDGFVISGDDDDEQSIEIDTLGGLEEGDTATILLAGETGKAMTPLAIGAPGSIDRISLRISDIEADYIKTTQLEAAEARIGDLEADHVSTTDLNAATARIGTIEADYLKAADMTAEQARVGTLLADYTKTTDLQATYATITNLNAATGRISTLEANDVTISGRLTAAEGNITNLQSSKADISVLESDYITADAIEAAYTKTDFSNTDVAWIQNGVIKDGSISSAMINDVSANKLTAGTINGSVINVTNLNASNITTGTINGQRIGEGSLSLSKLEDDVYTESEVDSIVSNLQTQIDGAIETWTGTAVPTLSNQPASSWTTNAIKDTHVGDVYFVVNSNSQQNGYNYRFTKSGNTYSWQLIKDSDVTNALQRLTTAEGKITTFDSDISQLKTDTGTLTTKTTSLETRMSDAEDDILDKVDTTTFNEVSDTVDSHSQSISQMSTTLSNKADSSTVSSLTTRVSKNERDISGINTTIGSMQTTIESKADGSTVSTISNKLNTVSDTVDGHTQSISSITSTQTTMQGKLDKTLVETTQLWFSKSNTTAPNKPTTQVTSTSTDGNAWRVVVPAYNASYPNYYYCYQWKYSDGTYGWSSVTRDIAMGESQERARTAIANAANAQADIDGLDIGGRNLLYLTKDFATKSGQTSGGYLSGNSLGTRVPIVSETHKGLAVRHFMTSSIDSSTSFDDLVYANLLIPVSGKSYIFSFYAKGAGTVRTHFYPNNSGGTYKNTGSQGQSNTATDGATDFTVSSDWQRFWVRFEIGGTQGTNARHALIRAFGGNDIYVCGLKFEEATIATDWTPAPEDIDADISTIESRVTNAETSITNNAEQIALRAKTSDVYTKTQTDGLISTEVSNRNAAIQLASDNITSTVAATYTTKTEFNNLEIGGRNLLKYSRDYAKGYGGSVNGDGDIDGTYKECSVWRYTKSQTSSHEEALTTTATVVAAWMVGPDEDYVLSFWAKASVSLQIYSYFYFSGNNTCTKAETSTGYSSTTDIDGGAMTTIGTEWERYWVRWHFGPSTDPTKRKNLIIARMQANMTGTVWIAGPKLEKGTKDTDWTPASEDVETRMTSAETIIEQTANNVLIKATENDTTAAQGGQHLIQSLINVAPSGVTISADKVNIEGAAIFTSGRLSEESLNDTLNDTLNDRIGEIKDVGVNMMSDVMYEVTSSEYQAFYAFITEPLRANETYTLQLWNVDVSHTGKSDSTLGIGVYYCGSLVRLDNDQPLIGTDYFTNGHADHISLTFTFTESWATHSNVTSNHSMPYISIYNSPYSASGTMSLTIGKWKLEHGSVGTEWSKTGIAYARGGRNLLTSDIFTCAGVAGNTESLGPVSLATINSNFGPSTNGAYTGFETGEQYTFRAGFEVVDTSAQGVTTVGPVASFMYTDGSYDSWQFRYRISGINYGVLTSDPTKNVSKLILSYSNGGDWMFHEMKLERGGIATEYSFAPEDSLAVSQRIYYRTNVNTSTPSAPSSWVSRLDVVNLAWTTKRVPYHQTYKYLYTCEQRKAVDGTFIGTTDVLLDDTTTVIDGGNIITGSVSANAVNANSGTFNVANIPDLNASKITAGDIAAARIKTNVISAINSLTAGQIDAQRINASQLTIGSFSTALQNTISNDKMSIGGRNLLRKSTIQMYDTSANKGVLDTDAYPSSGTVTYSRGAVQHMGFYVSQYALMSGSTDYIISFKAKVTSGSITQLFVYSQNPNCIASSAVYMDETKLGAFNAALTVSMASDTYYDFRLEFTTTAAIGSGAYTGQIIQWNKFVSTAFEVEMTGLKWERGNKPTDWSAAPEDIEASIEKARTDAFEGIDNVTSSVDELASTVESNATEQANINAGLTEDIAGLRTDFETDQAAREQWLTFNGSDGMTIGEASSEFKTHYTSTDIDFIQGDEVLMNLNGTDGVNAPKVTANEVHLGGWMWVNRENGNLSLKYIG